MLDTRETNILRHALTTRSGLVAERLSLRLADGTVDPGKIPADERAEGAEALDAYASSTPSFGGIAADVARQLRSVR